MKPGKALMALALVLAAPAAAQDTTTTCRNLGDAVRCSTTTQQQSTPPIDYAAALKAGRDLVPPYVPPPRQPVDEPREVNPRNKDQSSAALINYSPDLFVTGNGLLSACSSEDLSLLTVCHAYIAGASESFAGALAFAKTPQEFCLPSEVTMGQERLVVVKWLQAHPEHLHNRSAVLVVNALKQAFPCPAP